MVKIARKAGPIRLHIQIKCNEELGCVTRAVPSYLRRRCVELLVLSTPCGEGRKLSFIQDGIPFVLKSQAPYFVVGLHQCSF